MKYRLLSLFIVLIPVLTSAQEKHPVYFYWSEGDLQWSDFQVTAGDQSEALTYLYYEIEYHKAPVLIDGIKTEWYKASCFMDRRRS
jgi:hypothetical protein